ncbi:PAS domain S-box protein [Mucilaginibacter sp. HMF5004]|uniref:PAS domain S-box protein n=1 Tax=Mucilaginibacter rivuli TaxID=2857527 RepID=UPI001C5FF567|nr:PAS domain S-box protein [Mucilaginibacter rivuli]MBW4889815.1 PAS domain S-box protein [Mucilaginibacter rivuli]
MARSIPDNGYKDIFNNCKSTILVMDIDAPVYTILDVNEAYLQATNTTRETLVGKGVFAAFPANPTDEVSKNIERTIFSFNQAISTKKPHTMSNYRYDIPIRGTNEFEERYWTTTNTPILDAEGNVAYFIHSPENVTELYKLAEREKAGIEALKNQRKQLYSTFMQAPVGIAIFHGPEYIVELINPPLCELYNKTLDEMLGKPVFDVLNHARGIGFEELLDNVRLTGVPFKGQGLAAPLMRNGRLETAYLDFVYEPFREDDGTISGVIAVAIEVTEQINSRKKLEEAEERTRLAVDAVGLGTYDLDLITGEMLTSAQFANIFGFKAPVKREEYVAVFHTDDLELRTKSHKNALITGHLMYEARVIWPDQSIHWVRIEGKVFYDALSQPVRILGTLLDITEQRSAKEEQRKLITLVDNSVDLMSILNMDGTNSYINQAGMNLLGFDTLEQVIQTPIAELHTPDDFTQVQNEVLPVVMAQGRWSGIMLVRHLKSREIFPVFNNCIRIDDPVSGKPIAVGAVMRDMRPEMLAKQALADSEELLRNITSATPTGLWVSNEEGYITYVNQTWINWTGLNYAEQMGKGWLNALITEDHDKTVNGFLKALNTRSHYEAEFRINHTDGTRHWCVATGKPQYQEDGTFNGYIGACVDITEQKHLQQQKDDFIGIASHELKTPVTSIKAYTQVLERMLLKKGEIKEANMINRMDGQINRLNSLVGDLLDVTKINSGKLQFNPVDFDFNTHVKDLIEDLQRTTDKHTLVANFDPTGIVYGDKERIGQVITNLITNAIKYSPNADKIIISSSVNEGNVKLCIQDFGIGIAEKNLDKVFEQFYRVSGDMQHTFPGLGLGLYISSEIIKRENGRIWVSSKEGEGSKFCFSLPLKNSAPQS